MEILDDPLWPHFESLWQELAQVGGRLLVAGGYGLFLKQRWLAGKAEPRIVVPLERWLDASPRVTKDLDLVVGLDLIADEYANGRLREVLEKHGFRITDRREGQRWQFVKDLGEKRRVVVELHAASPAPDENRLKADRIRVKHKPSLGVDGVHGRHNPEALGCEFSPFEFSIGGVGIVVPNPVTWTVMKLTAASDRWNRAQQSDLDVRERSFSREHAVKHIHDACRVVAMMSMEERDAAGAVIDVLRGTMPFRKTLGLFLQLFDGKDAWATEILRARWAAEDLNLIIEVLGSWYRIPDGAPSVGL